VFLEPTHKTTRPQTNETKKSISFYLRNNEIVSLILLYPTVLKHHSALIRSVLSTLLVAGFQGPIKTAEIDRCDLFVEAKAEDAMIEDLRATSKHSRLDQRFSTDRKKGQPIVDASVEARSSSRIRQRRQRQPETSTEERGSVLMGLCPTRVPTVPDLRHQKKTKASDTVSPYESCLSVMLRPQTIPNVRNEYARPPAVATMGGILSIVNDLNRTKKRQGKDPSILWEKRRVRGLPGMGGSVVQVPTSSGPRVLSSVFDAQFQGDSLISHFSDKPRQSRKQRCKSKDSIKHPCEEKENLHLKKVSALHVQKESCHGIPGGVLASHFPGVSLASLDIKQSQQSTKQRNEKTDSTRHPFEKKASPQQKKVPIPGPPKGRSHKVSRGALASQFQGRPLNSNNIKDYMKHPSPFETLPDLKVMKLPSTTTHSQIGGGGSKARSLSGHTLQQPQVPAIHGLMGFIVSAASDGQETRREKPSSACINVQSPFRQQSISSGTREHQCTVSPGNSFQRDTVSSNPSNAAKPSTNGSRVAIADSSCAYADLGNCSSNPNTNSNGTKTAEKLTCATKSTSNVGVGDLGKAEFSSLASPQQSSIHSRKLKLAQATSSTSSEMQKLDTAKDRETDAASFQAVKVASKSRKRKGVAKADMIPCGVRNDDKAALPSQKRPKVITENKLEQQQDRGTNCEENPGKPTEESNQSTRMISRQNVLSKISTQDNHGKQEAKSTMETLEVSVLIVDSIDADSLITSLARNNGMQLHCSLPSRALSRRSLRQRNQPRRYCEEFMSGQHNETIPRPGLGCSPKDGKRLDESNLEALTDQLQQPWGSSSDNTGSRKPLQRRSDRKRTKPIRFMGEIKEFFTRMELSKCRQNVARGTQPAAKAARSGRSHRRGSVGSTAGDQRVGSKRKANGYQKGPIDEPTEFVIMEDNGCEKISQEPTADPIDAIVTNGSSSSKGGSKSSSSAWASSEAPPGNASLRTLATSGLLSSSTKNSHACQRPMKRMVCCDQLEEVANLQSLVQDYRNNAPILNPVIDHNTFAVEPESDVVTRPRQTQIPTDFSTCCYDDLAIDDRRTCLRILAHLPPNIVELAELSTTLPRSKNASNAVDPALKAQAVLLRGNRVPKRRAGVTNGSSLASPERYPLEEDQENVDVWSSEDFLALKTAYQQANAKSITFWDDIAARVPGKTTSACRQQWFSSAKTPLQKKKARILADASVSAEDEDDLFNSTPLRGCNARLEKGRLFSSFESDSPIKFDKHATSEPVLSNDDDNLGIVDFRFKPGYKTYIRDMKKKVRRGHQRQQKQKPNKAKHNALIVSERFGDGEVEMRGDLSPGGTLRVQHMFSDDEEDMFLHGSDAEEEEEESDA
jgi:hypothetical protein